MKFLALIEVNDSEMILRIPLAQPGRPPIEIPQKLVLTPRQRETMVLLSRGLCNKEVASAMGISIRGAKWNVSTLLKKLGLSSRHEVGRPQ